jgi:uncharacterized protein involved in type VI secretion and phage assembly
LTGTLHVQISGEDGLNKKLLVKGFELHQQIGQPDVCFVDVTTEDFSRPDISSLFGKSITATANMESGATDIFSGFIIGATEEHQLYGGWALSLEGASQSAKLMWSRRANYYYKKTISDIAGELSQKNGGIPIDVQADGKKLNYVQQGESDFEFLNRLADDCGCCVVTTDSGVAIRKGFEKSVQLKWHDDLFYLQVRGRIGANSVQGAFFDSAVGNGDRFPAQHDTVTGRAEFGKLYDPISSASKSQLSSQQDVDTLSARVHLSDYQQMLKSESRRRLGRSLEVEAHSRNPNVAPGSRVNVTNMPKGAGNGEYGVIQAVHRYLAADGYTNQLLLTPWLEYIPAEKPQRRFNNGVVTAIVVDNNDADKQGRIKIRYHWQEDSTSWVRFATPHSGGSRGMMFLPEIGDEVVIAFELGDPERPVIIGSLWNNRDQAPRDPYRQQSDIDQNETKRIITKSGNTISIIDTPNKEVIEFATPDNRCWLQLSNDKSAPDPKSTSGVDVTTSDVPRITLHSDGNIVLDAPAGDVAINCKNFIYKVSKDSKGTVGKDDTLQVAGKREVTVQQDHKLSAQNVQTSAMQGVKVEANATIDESAAGQITMKAAMIQLNP